MGTLYFWYLYLLYFCMSSNKFLSKMRLGLSLNCPSFLGKSEAHCPYKIVLIKKKSVMGRCRWIPRGNVRGGRNRTVWESLSMKGIVVESARESSLSLSKLGHSLIFAIIRLSYTFFLYKDNFIRTTSLVFVEKLRTN